MGMITYAKFLTDESHGVHVRWMVLRDMPEVVEVDLWSFGDHRWDGTRFEKFLHTEDAVRLVACDRKGRVVGYVLYVLGSREIRLVRLAVHPDFRGIGVGRVLVEKVRQKLSHRRPRLTLYVRESNIGACKFYARLGLRAVEVLPGHYGAEDGYLFEYRDVPDVRLAIPPEEVP